jgi:hypothetical protein
VIDPAAPVAGSAPAAAPQIHYVYVGGGTVSSSGGSAGTTRCSGC